MVVYLQRFIDNALNNIDQVWGSTVDLITSGVELMFAGMGIVFAFLAMLIGAINLMAAIIARFFPDVPIVERAVTPSTDRATIAAITAAVHQYRTKHK